MMLKEIRDEKDLKDGRVYLCCRSSRHGNAIWETLKAQKHQLIYDGMRMSLATYASVFDLPKNMAEVKSIGKP